MIRTDRERFRNIHTDNDKDYSEPGFDRGFDITYLLFVTDTYLKRITSPYAYDFLGEEYKIMFAKDLIKKVSGGHWTLLEHRREYQKTLIVTPTAIALLA